MNMHLRIARPVADLGRSAAMYRAALDLRELGRFEDHEGFDGVMLAPADGEAGYHVEFTCCRNHPVLPAPTPEDLWVLYVEPAEAWERRCQALLDAGFREVQSFNPYWARQGRSFEDPDGYRVVIQRAAWRPTT
jgi:catechol 2,3-dioxygenase-like lactoylglutathione lyase family enzyme